MVKLSIIIPAYNEEKRILKTLETYNEFFSKKFKNEFEILVIVNNSKDNTLGIVKEFSRECKQIKYKNFNEAIGKGGAILEGFKIAKGDLIGFVDADNATRPESFYNLVENIKDYDGIIASRWIKGAKMNIKQPLIRRIGSRGFNFLVKLFFGINLSDTQCGAKLFKNSPLRKIAPKLGITKWAFDIDLLYLMRLNKFRVKEIPTIWYDDKESKLKVVKVTIEMFLAIMRLRLIYSPFKFIVRIYDKVLGRG